MSDNAHDVLDKKDQRTNANRLAAASDANRMSDDTPADPEAAASQVDPTLPAKIHGNDPSRGAEIDKEIQQEEEELLKKKGAL